MTEKNNDTASTQAHWSDELAQIIKTEQVEESTALAIQEGFNDFCQQAEKWRESALALKVTDIGQKAEMKQARESRLALKNIRVGLKKKHDDIKADALARCKAIDKALRFLTGKIEPLESHLKEQEEFADRYMEKKRQEMIEARAQQLRDETDTDPSMLNLGDMTEEQFSAALQQGKDARQARIDREKAEERARIEREEQEREERERIRKENERLKAEAEERERKAEEERKKREAEDLARREAEAKAEAERIERHKKILQRQAQMQEVGGSTDYEYLAGLEDAAFWDAYQSAKKADAERREREEAERKEREAKEKAEREEREKREAEEKAEFERIERELEASREAERRAEEERASKAKAEEELQKGQIKSAARAAAAVVGEIAESWAKNHPRTKNGEQRFIKTVIAELESRFKKEDKDGK